MSKQLSTQEAADFIGVSVFSINAWIKAGYLPAEKEGRANLIAEETAAAVVKLRDEHGKKWHEHAEWESAGDDDETDEGSDSAEEVLNLHQKMVLKSKEFSRRGDHVQAYNLLLLMVESLDLSGL